MGFWPGWNRTAVPIMPVPAALAPIKYLSFDFIVT